MRPLEYLGVPRDGWTDEDRLLAGALEEYEGTRVGAFGYPKRLTEGDTEGWFEVVERQDNAQLAWDQWQADHKDKHSAPGMVPRVTYTG